MGWIDDFLQKHREAIMYLICGGGTVVVSWVSYAAFVQCDFELNLSNILSWIIAVIFAFVVNKWLVFRSTSTKAKVMFKELSSFFGARVVTGIISIVLFPILFAMGMNESLFHVDGFLAKITTSVIEIALNWIFSKYYIFKVKEEIENIRESKTKE